MNEKTRIKEMGAKAQKGAGRTHLSCDKRYSGNPREKNRLSIK